MGGVLRATTKKGGQLFRGRKVHPQTKSLATPMSVAYVCTTYRQFDVP